jgi:high affinity Mn2+ porin
MKTLIISCTTLVCINSVLFGQFKDFNINQNKSGDSLANWTLHIQNTTVFQTHPAFKAKYFGLNSLDDAFESATSNTTTLFVGRKLWKNAAVYINPEVTGGNGLSKTKGLAGFSNGEIYRVGAAKLTPFIARAYVQQIIPLNKKSENQNSDINQLDGHVPSDRLVVSIGKFCVSDFFDDNTYNHDARSQFLNWSLMAQGAWDFPADVRGYTTGFVIELIHPTWALRFSSVRVPRIANDLPMDWNLAKANSETLEYEQHWKINNLKGAVRTTIFSTFSKAPLYKDAIAKMAVGDSSLNDIISGDAEAPTYYGGVKYGFGINIEQALNKNVGWFARYSWNNGTSASWAFTEIDRSFQTGAEISGLSKKKNDNVLGIAAVINGLSPDHKNYLQAGGYGFIIGDGKLNYAHEIVFEAYYRWRLASFATLSADYQLIVNPAYNKDRTGPVHIPAIRLHFEW